MGATTTPQKKSRKKYWKNILQKNPAKQIPQKNPPKKSSKKIPQENIPAKNYYRKKTFLILSSSSCLFKKSCHLFPTNSFFLPFLSCSKYISYLYLVFVANLSMNVSLNLYKIIWNFIQGNNIWLWEYNSCFLYESILKPFCNMKA